MPLPTQRGFKPIFTYRSEIRDGAVRKEFEQLYAALSVLFETYFNSDGSMRPITTTGLTIINNPALPGGGSGGISIVNQFGQAINIEQFVQVVVVDISHAQIDAWDATAIEIVPAPGPGRILVPIHMHFTGDFTDAYSADPKPVLRYTDIAGPALTDAGSGDASNLAPMVHRTAIDADLATTQGVNQPLVVSGNALTGGAASNLGRIAVAFYVVSAPDNGINTPTEEGCAGAIEWEDDFESGTLAAKYTTVSNMTQAAGVGVGGSAGLQSDVYLGELRHTLSPYPGTRRGCVTYDLKADSALASGKSGFYYIEIHGENNGLGCGVYSGGLDGTGFGDLRVYTTFGFEENISAALVGDVFESLSLEFEFSSVVGGVVQSDGWMKVRVNGVIVSDLTGLVIDSYHAASNPNNYWGRYRVGPQGYGDNLVVRSD